MIKSLREKQIPMEKKPKTHKPTTSGLPFSKNYAGNYSAKKISVKTGKLVLGETEAFFKCVYVVAYVMKVSVQRLRTHFVLHNAETKSRVGRKSVTSTSCDFLLLPIIF